MFLVVYLDIPQMDGNRCKWIVDSNHTNIGVFSVFAHSVKQANLTNLLGMTQIDGKQNDL